ncbi:MAG: hypothetical protein U5K43_10050 [Halofilum sp. (in: g-proteobacteria)]|nr:hypothetical protein [Halofilum sp. (in: g-proteobacteria)]
MLERMRQRWPELPTTEADEIAQWRTGCSLTVVVDTMVYAYALLGVTEYRDAAARTFAAGEPVLVPDSLWAELGNVCGSGSAGVASSQLWRPRSWRTPRP